MICLLRLKWGKMRMSSEKQIEEMANDINLHCVDLSDNYCGSTNCTSCLARALHKAGYRKQSEGENISQMHPSDEFICEKCGLIIRDCCRYEIDEDDGDEICYEFPYRFCPRCGMKVKDGTEIVYTPVADVVPRSELENLKYTLLGVMHSVDKWLDGDELEQDEVNRAATMREKTLRIVENVRGEAAKEILKKVDDVLWKHKLSGHINIDSIHNDIEKLKKEYTKGGEG